MFEPESVEKAVAAPSEPPSPALSDVLAEALADGPAQPMMALLVALARLADGLSARGDAELCTLVSGLCELADAVETARLAVVGEWEARSSWALDGAPSGASWLAARGRLSRASAGGPVRTARQLRTMPVAAPDLQGGVAWLRPRPGSWPRPSTNARRWRSPPMRRCWRSRRRR
jgi:hypothetical protein